VCCVNCPSPQTYSEKVPSISISESPSGTSSAFSNSNSCFSCVCTHNGQNTHNGHTQTHNRALKQNGSAHKHEHTQKPQRKHKSTNTTGQSVIEHATHTHTHTTEHSRATSQHTHTHTHNRALQSNESAHTHTLIDIHIGRAGTIRHKESVAVTHGHVHIGWFHRDRGRADLQRRCV